MRHLQFESCGRSMRWYEWLAGLLLLACACGVRAQPVYKCTSADGSVAYQDRGCAPPQLEQPVGIVPAPPPQPSPRYAVREASTAPVRAGRAGGRRRMWEQDEPLSFECHASNGAVFYRHAACPKSLRADATHDGKARDGKDKPATLSVTAQAVPRAQACAQIRRAGAIGRSGHEHDEQVSTYERNLGHDPCR